MKINKTKSIVFYIICILILCFMVPSMLLFSLLTPYEDALGFDFNQVDDDALLVLRIYWSFTSVLNLITSFFVFRKKPKIFFVLFSILAVLSVAKLISLFLI